MESVEDAIRKMLADWSDDDGFFERWSEFIHGPLAKHALREVADEKPVLALPRRKWADLQAANDRHLDTARRNS